MLDYISSFVSIFFLSIPFLYVLDFVFNILQIPFALIHRYAARCIFVYKMYILCQFYSIMTYSFVELYNVNAVVLLIIESLLLWYSVSGAIRDTQKNDYETGSNHTYFVYIISLCAIPVLWFVYYFHISFLNQPVGYFFKIIEFAYNIPVVGNILGFFTRATAVWAVVFFVIIMVVVLIVLLQKLLSFIKCRD